MDVAKPDGDHRCDGPIDADKILIANAEVPNLRVHPVLQKQSLRQPRACPARRGARRAEGADVKERAAHEVRDNDERRAELKDSC